MQVPPGDGNIPGAEHHFSSGKGGGGEKSKEDQNRHCRGKLFPCRSHNLAPCEGMGRMMFDPSHIQVSCHGRETLEREWKGMDRGLCNRPIKVKKPKAGGKRREERTERRGVFKGEKGARKCTRICASCPNSCALEAKHHIESPAKPPTHRPIIFSGNPAKARPAIRVQAFWVPFRGI